MILSSQSITKSEKIGFKAISVKDKKLMKTSHENNTLNTTLSDKISVGRGVS